ncbi:hypothetical protein QFW77_13200 [Luteimonas sp. RD2P54]|uniref:SRPBCC domain-containing protein n=1 Tax=Luteimonas endophytica TaxID=3042023 RepID=A0ABT6JAS4_9GAMM|nr:hypothetical protein [Luteimonas endophytica]MDH5823935.1 hypothetical protein [Luteimonas endophytica]
MATLHHQIWIDAPRSLVYSALATAQGLGRWPSPGQWLGLEHEGKPMTVVDFQHRGWDEESPFFGFCNCAWGVVLDMLKRWCESLGTGADAIPAPGERP